MKVIKGASNGNELLLVFEQIVETSRPDGFVLLERGDTFLPSRKKETCLLNME